MNTAEAIALLRENQPFPEELTPDMEAKLRSITRVLRDDPDEAALPLIVNCFARWDDESVIEGFQSTIRRYPAEAVAPHLMRALQSDDWATRMYNAELASVVPDPRLIGPLSNLLKDASESIRLAAAAALERIGGPRVRRIAHEQMRVEQDEDVLDVWHDILRQPT